VHHHFQIMNSNDDAIEKEISTMTEKITTEPQSILSAPNEDEEEPPTEINERLISNEQLSLKLKDHFGGLLGGSQEEEEKKEVTLESPKSNAGFIPSPESSSTALLNSMKEAQQSPMEEFLTTKSDTIDFFPSLTNSSKNLKCASPTKSVDEENASSLFPTLTDVNTDTKDSPIPPDPVEPNESNEPHEPQENDLNKNESNETQVDEIRKEPELSNETDDTRENNNAKEDKEVEEVEEKEEEDVLTKLNQLEKQLERKLSEKSNNETPNNETTMEIPNDAEDETSVQSGRSVKDRIKMFEKQSSKQSIETEETRIKDPPSTTTIESDEPPPEDEGSEQEIKPHAKSPTPPTTTTSTATIQHIDDDDIIETDEEPDPNEEADSVDEPGDDESDVKYAASSKEKDPAQFIAEVNNTLYPEDSDEVEAHPTQAAASTADGASQSMEEIPLSTSDPSTKSLHTTASQKSDAASKARAVREMLQSGGRASEPGVQDIPTTTSQPPDATQNSSVSFSNDTVERPSNHDSLWNNGANTYPSMTSIPENVNEDMEDSGTYDSRRRESSRNESQSQPLLPPTNNTNNPNSSSSSTHSDPNNENVHTAIDIDENNENTPLTPFQAQIVDENEDDQVITEVVQVDPNAIEEQEEKDAQKCIQKWTRIAFGMTVLIIGITVPVSSYYYGRRNAPSMEPSLMPSSIPSMAPSTVLFQDVVMALSEVSYPTPAEKLMTDQDTTATTINPASTMTSESILSNTTLEVNGNGTVDTGFLHNITGTNVSIGDAVENTTISENDDNSTAQIMLLSPETLLDVSSPQYKAIEWLSSSMEYTNVSLSSPNFVQRYVVAVLYFALGGDTWTVCSQSDIVCKDQKPPHLSGVNECDWFGIKCGNSDGMITQMKLNNNELRGTIPPEIGMLTSLEFIFLSNNDITGTIPTTFHYLSSLRILRLEGNYISSPIPSSFFDTPMLETIYLRTNMITGTIPTSFGKLQHLRQLDMQFSFLTGSIPSEFGQLSKLEDLMLLDNQLSGTIPDSLYDIDSLERLIIGRNQLTGMLSQKLGEMPNLKVLNVTRNGFDGEIPIDLFFSQSLQVVDLSDNELSGMLSSEVKSLTSLRHLYLQGNAFQGTIPKELGENELISLKLHGNFFEGTVPREICDQRGTERQDLRILTADCGDVSPKVFCDIDCCTMCV